MNIIFVVRGNLYTVLLSTAVSKAIRTQYPTDNLIVVCEFPEVYFGCNFIDRVYRFDALRYFYTDYIEYGDNIVFDKSPFEDQRFISDKLHVIETWCAIHQIKYSNELPCVFLSEIERKDYVVQLKTNRPILLINFFSVQDTYCWYQDIPKEVVFRLVTDFSKNNDVYIVSEKVIWDDRKYEKIVNKIISLPGKVLIVIDNLQHEGINSVEAEIKKLLQKEQLNIIITSRQPFSGFTPLQLNPLDRTSAKAIFFNNCPKTINDDGVEELIDLVDSNALLLELIAKTIYQGVGLTVRKVIETLKEGKVEDNFKIEVEHVLDSGVLTAPLYIHLLKIVDLDKVEPIIYEFYLARLLSILPSSFIKIEDIFTVFLYRELEPHNVVNAINSLHKKGIITRMGDEIKMHQMVQDVIRIQLKSFVVFLDILNSISHSIHKANNSFSNNGYRIAVYAESILAKLIGDKALGVKQPLMLVKNNLYLMYRYLGEHNKAGKIAHEIINEPNLEQILQSSIPIFAQSINHNIATYYFDVDNIASAEIYFKRAIQVNCDEANINVIKSYNALFEIYYSQKNLVKALEYIGLGLECWQQFPEGKHDDVFANLLCNLAVVNSDFGKINEAMFYITEAIKTYREYEGETKNNGMLAAIYSNAAMVFSRIKNFEVAIQFALHAIEYQSMLKLERDERILIYYNRAAVIYDLAEKPEYATQLREIIKAIQN